MHPAYRSSARPLLRVAGVLLALLVLLTACDALGGIGATPTPRGSARPSATPRPTPEPSIPPGAVVLEVRNRQFSTAVIDGVAGVPTLVYFTNHDDMNHNLTIYRNASLDLELFRGVIFSGPDATVIYEIPAQPAGEYYFSCYVVPSMHGRFIVH
jgi:plastocyanin